MRTPYISTCFLRGFSALVLSKGGNLPALYESVGLDKETFIEERQLMPFDKFVYLLEAAAHQLDFPDVAMQLARQQDMMILAPLGPMLRHCRNVSEALGVIVKYLKILVSGYEVDIKVHHDYITITFSLELPHIQELVQYQDYAMASAVNILYGLLGKSYPIRACYFLRSERNQRRIAEYSRYYRCPVAFNSQTLSATADSSILHLDIGDLVKQLNARVKSAQLLHNESIVNQASNIISFSLANGISKIDDITSSMNYSQRTLQRKLSEHNTSFSALLDSVRFNMANQYLKNTYYRQTDIAVLLGYSNLSSFSRSYHRWCGVYPMEARKRMQKER
jgi:AraC-like DNA-binding protein